MLIISLCMGTGLILFAEILRWAMGKNGSLVAVAAQLFVVGIIFIIFQYILLRPLLHGNRKHE